MNQILVLPADEERIVVEGLGAIIEREPDFCVIGRPTSAQEALELATSGQPDVVVSGLRGRGVASLAAFAESLRARAPRARLLLLAASTDEASVRAAAEIRADGCVARTIAAADLVQAIRLVAHGQFVYPAIVRPLPRPEGAEQVDCIRLTEREREVLRLVAIGQTSREIADQLVLSAKTVDNHRSRIIEKLQVRNKAEAVALAFRRGLLNIETLGASASRDEAPEAVEAASDPAVGRARGEGLSRRQHTEALSTRREVRPASGAA